MKNMTRQLEDNKLLDVPTFAHCPCNKRQCKNKLGTFTVTRTPEETKTLADYFRVKPECLPNAQLNNILKGVTSVTYLITDSRKRLMDAAQTDINFANFFKSL